MVKIIESFNNLNESLLKNFICTVELVNYTNIVKQLGNTTSRKAVKIANTLGTKANILKKPINIPNEKSILTETEALMKDLDDLSKEELISRLTASIEEKAKNELSVSKEILNTQTLEETMVDAAAHKYKIDENKSYEEKVQIIKVAVEKEIREINLEYQNMDTAKQAELEQALDKDIELLSEKEIQDLKNHLNLDKLNGAAIKEVLTKSGGALSLMMVPSLAGFSSYVALTTIMHAVFTTTLGITLPFAAYTGATSFMGILSGPVGWVGLSGLTLYTLRKNRNKLTQTIMAQIVGITALMSETEEEYLDTLPSWLSNAQKKRLVELKNEFKRQKKETQKLKNKKVDLEKQLEENTISSKKLANEIDTLKLIRADQEQENDTLTGRNDTLTGIIKDKECQLKVQQHNIEQAERKSKKLVREMGISDKNIKSLVESISRAILPSNPNDKKGNLGELKSLISLFGELPSLSKDAHIIPQPQIGRLSPDLLVMHPEYGFRILEVKSWRLETITSVQSNGSMVINNKYNKNPFSQAGNHAEQLYTYLSDNYQEIGNQFNNIGFCVLQVDFTKANFMNKFKSTIDRWEPKSREYFFKHCIFLDQLTNGELVEIMWKSRKSTQPICAIPSSKLTDIATSIALPSYFYEET